MFNIFKQPCDDQKLFGYICVAIGAEYRMHIKENRKFSAQEVLEVVELILQSQKLKLNQDQIPRVRNAAMIAEVDFFNSADFRALAKGLGDAQSETGFNFSVPEVEQLRDRLIRVGCGFDFENEQELQSLFKFLGVRSRSSS